ncbi:hypothetical protein FGP36_15125 [Salmonella enterica]|nr:hypothetical protein [Salmonella enterica]EDU5436792.1 hypothetical protein [Salmonella enterica subsp. enterica serovar Hadar]EBT8461052.1 hypothetical protein [Salmonella enterica]ECE1009282.1 hypothetical protein [Salmonella enterica]EDO2093414.1 hypothetical protein [Salmonella enterica]
MAATTKCPKCDGTSFELATNTKVKGCGHQMFFVQCSSCGCAISAISAREVHLVEQIAKKVGVS